MYKVYGQLQILLLSYTSIPTNFSKFDLSQECYHMIKLHKFTTNPSPIQATKQNSMGTQMGQRNRWICLKNLQQKGEKNQFTQ